MRVTTEALSYDVYVFTETYLNSNICSSELFNDSFVVFRHDRILSNTPKSDGGGVLIAVKNKFISVEIVLPTDPELYLEILAVKIEIGGRNLYIFAVYLPHWAKSEERSKAFCDILNVIHRTINSNDIFMCIGDFNMTHLSWMDDNDNEGVLLPLDITNSSDEILVDGILSLELSQINNVLNSNNRLLDLVFVTCYSDFLLSKADALVKSESHHEAISLSLPIGGCVAAMDFYKIPSFNFNKCDYRLVKYCLDEVDWTNLLECDSNTDLDSKLSFINDNHYGIINDMMFVQFMDDFSTDSVDAIDVIVYVFYFVLFDILLFCVSYTIRKTPKYPRWWSRELIQCKKEKDASYDIYCKSRERSDYMNFSACRRKFENVFKRDSDLNVSSIGSNFKSNPSSFWKYVNSKRKSNSLPSSMRFGTKVLSSRADICSSFAEHFSSVYCGDQFVLDNDFSLPEMKTSWFSKLSFANDEVFRTLVSLKANKGPGPDGIPPGFLKTCALQLSVPLALVFNL